MEPEKATLTEISGDVAVAPFKPEFEVFTDKEHIARASVHMTLLQLSKFTLKQTIRRALARQAGVPIDVRNPRVIDGRPVADVIIATDDCDEDNDAATVRVDLLSGATRLLD